MFNEYPVASRQLREESMKAIRKGYLKCSLVTIV
jgi:hypothetical protein